MHAVFGVQIHSLFIICVFMMVQRCVKVAVFVEIQKEHQSIFFSFSSSFVDPQCVAKLAIKDVRNKRRTDRKGKIWVHGHGFGNRQVSFESTKRNEGRWGKCLIPVDQVDRVAHNDRFITLNECIMIYKAIG